MGIKIQYDGDRNFVSVPLIKEKENGDAKSNANEKEEGTMNKGKDEKTTSEDSSAQANIIGSDFQNSVAVNTIVSNSQSGTMAGSSDSSRSSVPASTLSPPELPPRPSSSNSMGPPVSRLNKSPCDELDLLFPRMRRDSTRGTVGFDFGAGTWEVLTEEQKLSKSIKK